MSGDIHFGLPAGILFPSGVLESDVFAVFSVFVAINTVIFVSLAIAKMLPKLHPSDWLPGRNRRAETRSIYPDSTEHTAPRHRTASGRSEPRSKSRSK